jgi:ATP-dependent RNA helicase RhlE
MKEALVFTRTKHRANRLYEQLDKAGIAAERIHGNRSQPQRTEALAGFKSGKYRVLVATDIASRGIDVEALGHVVNFDVPLQPEDYIHRVGRTARAELTGEAFTFVAPDEEEDLRQIEKAIARRLPRVTVPDFDYNARPQTRFEIPIAERIAKIREQKREDRARAAAKAARRAGGGAAGATASGTGGSAGSGRSGAAQGARPGTTPAAGKPNARGASGQPARAREDSPYSAPRGGGAGGERSGGSARQGGSSRPSGGRSSSGGRDATRGGDNRGSSNRGR